MNRHRVLGKITEFFITVILASFLLFSLIHLAPGDPVKKLLGDPEVATTDQEAWQARYEEMRQELHLDQSLLVQYGIWAKRVLRFDLGRSIFSRRPVSQEIFGRLPATLMLAVPALLIQLIFGILLGVFSAANYRRWYDGAIRLVCVVAASVPFFALGLALLWYFGVVNSVYEISGEATWSRLWLPATILGVVSSPALIRMTRAGMLQEFGRLYILVALSRGLGRGKIVKQALLNVLLPVITMVALSFTSLLGGAVVVENIFSWPGIGTYVMDSILSHDYPVVQGYGVIMVFMILLVNLGVDVIYLAVDPRLKKQAPTLNVSGEKTHA